MISHKPHDLYRSGIMVLASSFPDRVRDGERLLFETLLDGQILTRSSLAWLLGRSHHDLCSLCEGRRESLLQPAIDHSQWYSAGFLMSLSKCQQVVERDVDVAVDILPDQQFLAKSIKAQ